MTTDSANSSDERATYHSLLTSAFFLNTLDTVETVEKLVRFYVTEHNERLPHSAFRGQTPDEMYFGNGDDVPDDLASARKGARNERLAVNRALACAVCEPSSDSDAA